MDAGVLASRIRNDEWPLRLSGAFAGRKSTRSSGGGSSCTEVAELVGLVAIRDSNNPEDCALMATRTAFRELVDGIRHGTFSA